MRVISTLAIAVLIVVTPRPSRAQIPGAPTHVATSQPSSDIQSLIKALSGHWSVKVNVESSSETPAGLEGTGDEAWHGGPGGLTLTDEEVLTVGPQTMRIVGFLWQDLKTGAFHAMDCSSENPHTCDLKGAVDDVVVNWNGSELTIDEKELSSKGKVMTSRAVWSDITPNSFTETGYLGSPGGPFQKVMTIHATRAVNG